MKAPTPTTTDSPSIPPRYSSLLFAWMLTWLAGLFLKAGVSPALRGAFVGADRFIRWSETAGNFFSQVTAVSTSTLLIVLSLASLRVDSKLVLRLVVALCASLPTAIVLLAQRSTLPYFATSLAAVSTGLVLLLGTLLSSRRDAMTWILLLCGLAVMGQGGKQFLTGFVLSEDLSKIGQHFSIYASGAATFVALLHLSGRRRPLKSALILGGGVLLGLASAHHGTITSPTLFVIGKSLAEITQSASDGANSAWLFSTVLLLLVANLSLGFRHPEKMIVTCVLLAAHAQLTPLTAGVIALGGVVLVLVHGTKTPQPLSPRHPHLVPPPLENRHRL